MNMAIHGVDFTARRGIASNLHYLAPQGSMELLLANGSMSSGSGGEGQIRRTIRN